jgi:hypothetical protein
MPDVKIRYGGQLFNTTTDFLRTKTPCPLVNIDTNADKDVNGSILVFRNTITLDGFVLGSGLQNSLAGYSGVVNFFSDPNKQSKNFEILCNNVVLLTLSGTQFLSSSAAKNENNWAVTLPYTISLESLSSPSGDPLIESYEDNWTIEPLEEVSYFSSQVSSPQYSLSPSASTTEPPSSTDLTTGSPNISISNFLQYRITHRLSATGKTIDRTNTNNPNPGQGITTNNLKSLAYMEAAKWVMNKARDSFLTNPGLNTTSASGITISNSTAPTGLRLYNHMRTIESSPSAGTYGITDTWLALGTGINYTEEFTWEISTDETFLRTVSLQGTIKGLEQAPNGYVTFPSGAMTGLITNNFGDKFSAQTLTNNKYANALIAYNSGVKPALYQRACMALASVSSGTTSSSPTNRVWTGPRPAILNIVPNSFTETLNPAAGTVGYSITYNNKPGQWLSGVLTSNLTVVDNNSTDQVAEIFVLGRALGPILEKVGTTKSERRFTLEVTYPIPTGFRESHPNSPFCVINKSRPEYNQLKSLVDAFKPVGATAFATLVPTSPYPVANQGQVFTTSDSSTWNPFEGRFSWDVTWVYNTGTCNS